jgi:hypothetical protein
MIVFFSMDGCGFCKKAEAELHDEIKKGRVHTDTGKIVTGYKPKAQLFEALGVSMENYEHAQDDERMHHGHMQHHGHVQEHMQHHGHMPHHMQEHMQKRAAAPTSCSEHYAEVATPKGAWGYATLGNYWR